MVPARLLKLLTQAAKQGIGGQLDWLSAWPEAGAKEQPRDIEGQGKQAEVASSRGCVISAGGAGGCQGASPDAEPKILYSNEQRLSNH